MCTCLYFQLSLAIILICHYLRNSGESVNARSVTVEKKSTFLPLLQFPQGVLSTNISGTVCLNCLNTRWTFLSAEVKAIAD